MMYDYGYMATWMGGWSLNHWLFFIVCVALVLYPLGLILKRLGYSPLWSVLAFVPVINLIALWLVALSEPRK